MAKQSARSKRTAKSEVGTTNEPQTSPKTEAWAGRSDSKEVSVDKEALQRIVKEGQALLKDGKSKADAAWAIYEQLKSQDKEVIVAAFVKGATLTEKGALTYWYNCRRREKKLAKKLT